jgi:hypothetical protein
MKCNRNLSSYVQVSDQNTKAGEVIVRKVILLVILLAITLCGYFLSVSTGVFAEEQLRAHLSELVMFRNTHPVYVSLLFCATFVVIAGLGMPVAAMLLIAGGQIVSSCCAKRCRTKSLNR